MTTVLLVEDDQNDARQAQRALGLPCDKPCTVHHVRRVRDATRYLRQHRGVDVVLSDINLPDAQGLEMLARLKRATSGVPVVLMTGSGQKALAADAVKQGAHDYLVKGDYANDNLIRIVRHAIACKKNRDNVAAARAANRRLRQQMRSLQQEQDHLKLVDKAKDDFISLASHQLRTPATGVKQYIGMVLEGFAGAVPEQLRPFLAKAYESNERQLSIVDDLLQVAQLDAGTLHLHRQPTDLTHMLLNIVSEQASKFGQRQQRLVFEPATPELMAEVDAARIRMVFDNLIDNASKYTPEGKTVSVRLESNAADKDISISVCDEGVGIAPENIDSIFEKFSRVPNPRSELVGGSGLGLYWAKRIVDLHGGAISVESEPGLGSKFIVRLPRASDIVQADRHMAV